MSFPIGLTGAGSGLILGGLFGYILQRGGLGNGCKLTGQLRLEDWTVFNVMFTAIIVAATGLWLLDVTGLMPADSIYVPETYLGPALLGGVLVGLGMAVGGYCPGTSVVAATAGRIDGLFFFAGLIVGSIAFAGAYERVGTWMDAVPPLDALTLPELLHVPAWLVIAALAAAAFTVHRLVSRRARATVS